MVTRQFIPLTPANLALALPVYQANRDYFALMGETPSEKTIAADLNDGPAGMQPDQKHFGVVMQARRPVAVLDVVTGYPGHDTAYIGLLLVADKGQGLGSQILAELESRLKAGGYQQIGLAVLSNNPRGRHFWAQHGFVATGSGTAQAADGQVGVINYQKTL